MSLVVISTHPIQYHAPIYRLLQQKFRIPVTAIYGSDFSVAGYRDQGFGVDFRWDTDLLSGYASVFLSRVSEGGACSPEEVSSNGIGAVLKKISPKAVMILGYSPRFHRAAFAEALKTGYPILFRSETTDHTRGKNPAKNWARDIFLRRLYGRCAALLYIGQLSHLHFKRLGVSDEKLFSSPYGVETAPFQFSEESRAAMRERFRGEMGVTSRQKLFLFSGKLIERKAPRLILKAVKRFPSELRERSVVVFLGDGVLREDLKRIAQETPLVKAVFVGFQNQMSLSGYYHAADLLALPSVSSETWGLVVNEALCHGLPCVVSDAVGCVPDLVDPGVTGEVAEAGNARSLMEAFRRAENLIGDPHIRHKCREKVSGYSMVKAAEGVARAFQTVTGSHASD